MIFFKTFFFLSRPFKKKCLSWICYNIASVLCFGFGPEACACLSSPTRDQTPLSWIGRWSLNHQTTREGPLCAFLSCTMPVVCSVSSPTRQEVLEDRHMFYFCIFCSVLFRIYSVSRTIWNIVSAKLYSSMCSHSLS